MPAIASFSHFGLAQPFGVHTTMTKYRSSNRDKPSHYGEKTPARSSDTSAAKALPARPIGHSRYSMADTRKIVRYTIEALLILVPLAIVIYFVTNPAAFDAALDWLVGRHK
jgi:hypothetical protein